MVKSYSRLAKSAGRLDDDLSRDVQISSARGSLCLRLLVLAAVVLLCLLVSVLASVLVFSLQSQGEDRFANSYVEVVPLDEVKPSCSSVPLEYRLAMDAIRARLELSLFRFDCDPDPHATPERCAQRGCCWSPPEASQNEDLATSVPYCFYPTGHRSHAFVNATRSKHGFSLFYALLAPSGYPKDVQLVQVDLIVYADDILRIKV